MGAPHNSPIFPEYAGCRCCLCSYALSCVLVSFPSLSSAAASLLASPPRVRELSSHVQIKFDKLLESLGYPSDSVYPHRLARCPTPPSHSDPVTLYPYAAV